MGLRGVTLAVFVLLNLLDWLTTRAGIAGGFVESSPLPAVVLAVGGISGLFFYKMVLTAVPCALVVYLPQYPRLRYSLHTCSAILALVLISNLSLLAG